MKDGQVYIYGLLGRDDGPKYVGYVVLNGEFLGVRFEGDQPHKITADAFELYVSTRAKREATIANREAGRQKAAERKASKSEVKP